MEIRAVREKEPELKFKKEAEVAIHKKNSVVTEKESPIICRKKLGADILGVRSRGHPEKDGNQDEDQGRRSSDSREKPFHENTGI